jgi:hypothetical protein
MQVKVPISVRTTVCLINDETFVDFISLVANVVMHSRRGGHHVVIPIRASLRLPVMPADGQMTCVMAPADLRLAGQVELASLPPELMPNPERT